MNKTENQKGIDEKIKDFKPQQVEAGYAPLAKSTGSKGLDSGGGVGGNISIAEEKIKQLEERIEGLERRTFYSEGLNKIFTSAPTYMPKTFSQQFVLYDTGGVRRLYVFVNGSWRYSVLT